MEGETVKKIHPLDLEFKKILCVIRKQIPYINNNIYLNQCRIWLEKLSDCNEEKVQRNLYLAELARQIQKNKLTSPFHQPPPLEGLKNFIGNFKVPTLQKIKEESSVFPSIDQFGDLVQPLQSEDEESDTQHPNSLDVPIKLTNRENMNYDGTKCASGEPNDIDMKNKEKLDVGESDNALGDIIPEQDDSWVDLTETSSSEFGFGPEDGQKHKEITKLWQENDVGEVQKKQRADTSPEHFFSESEVLEMVYPKTKILKDTNYISEDWKNTIEALQLRLSEMIHQNRELKGTIKRMEIQMEDNLKKHEIDLSRKLKVADEHWMKEINKMKEIHADNIFELEKSYRNKLGENNMEHENRYDRLLEDCEKRISEAKIEKDCIVKQKEDEIRRLTDIIHEQCVRITSEITNLQNQVLSCSCAEKMNLLRKCISKMEKLFQRSEKEHSKQIEKLKQELEIKDSTLKIQLKTQKAELLTRTTSERQEEFEQIVNTLEVKYIQMLEMHEIQVMEMKRQSDEKIERMMELLLKNGVPLEQIDVSQIRIDK